MHVRSAGILPMVLCVYVHQEINQSSWFKRKGVAELTLSNETVVGSTCFVVHKSPYLQSSLLYFP